jgi:hypothetical protein
MMKHLLAAALMLAASPAMAWCGNTSTNCRTTSDIKNFEYAKTHPGFHYEPQTLEQKVEEAQDEIDALKRKVKDLEGDVEILKFNAR